VNAHHIRDYFSGLPWQLGRNLLWLYTCRPAELISGLATLLVVLVTASLLQANLHNHNHLQSAVSPLPLLQGPSESPPSYPPPHPVADSLAPFADSNHAIFCGGAGAPYVALSFDDGPGPHTQQTVNELRQANQRATFFLIGRQLHDYDNVVKQELTVGTVGDHTWSHPFLARLSPDKQDDELGHAKAAIESLSGQPVSMARPPEDSVNAAVRQAERKFGMVQVNWSVDSGDAEHASAAQITDTVREGLRPGAIVLMHENQPETQKALPQILAELKRKNLQSVTIPELMKLDPPSPQQVDAGSHVCPLVQKKPSAKHS
jgi:peptidoglycan/xylan/chitin deacetylase (PgdA/CDA1 family)